MIRSLLLLLALFASGETVRACSCFGAGPPCQAFWNTDAVFVATVTSKSLVVANNEEYVSVRLASEQVFRGNLGGREVEVLTAPGEAACGYHFETGKQYLVYASHWEKVQRLFTGICSRTRPLSEAEEDLAYLRNLPRENSGGKILVNVTRLTVPIDDDNRFDLAAMPGLRVTAERDNKLLEGTTDEKGTYEFTGVKPGKYNVRVYFPDDAENFLENDVDVVDRGCGSVPIFYQVGGNIEGRVIDSSGKTVNGVKVDLIRLEDATSDSPKGKWRFTNAEGSYKIPDVPPGKYVLGVNLIGSSNPHCPHERTYYVNPNPALHAGYVEIKPRQLLKDYDIQLSTGGAEQEIEGIVVWPDGKPAVRAAVTLVTAGTANYVVGGQKGVDKRGRFVLKGIEGCTYRINAFTYGGQIAADSKVIEEQRHAEPLTITLREKKPPLIKLTLTSPGFIHNDDEQRRPKN